jgi:hypothetical protein
MIKVRNAVSADIDKAYPDGLKFSVKAWVLEQDNKMLAIGGLILKKGEYTAFVRLFDKVPPKIFWRISKEKIKELLESVSVFEAIRDKNIESSERYLKKLGFHFSETNNNQDIYIIWRKR